MVRSALVLLVVVMFAWPASSRAAGPPPKERFDAHGDPLPAGVVARLGSIRWRHRDGFHQPLLSPDGRWLVSTAFTPRRLLVWEAATGRLSRTLDSIAFGPSWPFRLYAFLPDGKRLLGLDDKQANLTLWEFPSFRVLERWPAPAFESMTVSPDGRYVAGGQGVRVYLLDLHTGRQRIVAYLNDGPCRSMAFTPDGGVAVVVDHPRGYRFYRIDRVTGAVSRRFTVPAVATWSPRAPLAPDGRHVAVHAADGSIRLWRPETGDNRRLLLVPPSVGSIDLAYRFRPDGRAVVVVDRWNEVIWAFDVGRGQLVGRVPLRQGAGNLFAGDLLVSPDGQALFAVGRHAVTRVNLRTGAVLHHPEIAGPVETLTWGRDGRSLLTGTESRLTRWDAGTGRSILAIPTPREYRDRSPSSLGLEVHTPNGGWLFADRKVHLRIARLDQRTGELVRQPRAPDLRLAALAVSGDGRLLAAVDLARRVLLWDLAGERQLRIVDAQRAASVKAVVFTADNRQVILVEPGGRLHLHDVQTGRHLRTLLPAAEGERGRAMPEARMATALSPDGTRLFVAYLGRLWAWDLRTGQERPAFEQVERDSRQLGSRRPVLSVSPDGRYLARLEQRLFLYELASGRIVHRFPGACTAAAFHPAQLRLAVADVERLDVQVYDLATLFLSRPAPTGRPALAAWWADLAGDDANRAHRALWRLVAAAGGEGFLAAHLKPVPRLDPRWVARQIADLGSDEFSKRRKAEQELAAVEDTVEAALRQAYARASDLEQRLRLRRLLARLKRSSPEQLRQHRSVLVLEQRATPEARRLLARLAEGMPGATLTDEAKRALERLARKGN
jgi:WD40 repeat protein